MSLTVEMMELNVQWGTISGLFKKQPKAHWLFYVDMCFLNELKVVDASKM